MDDEVFVASDFLLGERQVGDVRQIAVKFQREGDGCTFIIAMPEDFATKLAHRLLRRVRLGKH